MSKIPNDHTSDLIVNLPYRAASGAVHLMGNFAPKERAPGYSSNQEHPAEYGLGRRSTWKPLSQEQVHREDGQEVRAGMNQD